jgi:predicted transcriptional regulator
MTKLLDLAIAEVRKLPPAAQDEAAEMLLWSLETRSGSIPVDEGTIAAIEEGLAQAERGELATDAEVAHLWKRHGL